MHFILTDTITYLLHPNITKSIPNNAKIADTGTGTGIWLLELASKLPSTCTFVGYDISSDQYPPASSLPSNLSLRRQSTLDPFPESEKGTYDIVACRAMVTVLEKEQWKLALQNIVSLLKPGGWIQWVDFDASSGLGGRMCNLIPGPSRTPYFELMEGCKWFEKALNKDFLGVLRLGQLCREAGLKDLVEEVWSTSRNENLRKRYSKMALVALQRCCDVLVAAAGNEWSQERSDRVLGEVKKAVNEERAYMSGELHVVIAQRPA